MPRPAAGVRTAPKFPGFTARLVAAAARGADARRAAATRLLAVAVIAGCASVAHAANEDSLGRALYENRCTDCHEHSVHSRSPRLAGNFDQIRAYVYRWDRYLGRIWQRAEIDAVARYLNERYYHFLCPQDVCGVATR